MGNSHGSESSSLSPTASSISTNPHVAPSLQVDQSTGQVLRGRTRPREEDMEFIVPIHNAVNERAWSEVMRWEKEREVAQLGFGSDSDTKMKTDTGCADVRLVSFKGRPNDLSPKARFKSLIGYESLLLPI